MLCISIIKSSKLSKGKYKMFSLRIKGTPGNVMLNPSAVVKEIKFHKMLDVKLNEESGDLSATPSPAKFRTCKK